MLTPKLQSRLLLLVRNVLERNDGTDRVSETFQEQPETSVLRSLGFITVHGNVSKRAFLLYFDLIPCVTSPPEVEAWCSELGLKCVQWKRASGPLKNASRAFVHLNIVVIRAGAGLSMWFHELAHLAFSKIPKELVNKLTRAASMAYPIIDIRDRTTKVKDPTNRHEMYLPEGRYLQLNGRYCGLNHSGKDNENDELWANLFAQYCSHQPLDGEILPILGEIIDCIRETNGRNSLISTQGGPSVDSGNLIQNG